MNVSCSLDEPGHPQWSFEPTENDNEHAVHMADRSILTALKWAECEAYVVKVNSPSSARVLTDSFLADSHFHEIRSRLSLQNDVRNRFWLGRNPSNRTSITARLFKLYTIFPCIWDHTLSRRRFTFDNTFRWFLPYDPSAF